MAEVAMSHYAIQPRTDNPEQEAQNLTNDFKRCIKDISSPNSISIRCFDDYLNYILPFPNEPSEHSAKSKAKSYEGLHFWSSWLPWLKMKVLGDENDWKKYQEKKQYMEQTARTLYSQAWSAYQKEYGDVANKRADADTAFQKNEKDVVNDYFNYVLCNDQYSINGFDIYQVGIDYLQYEQGREELHLSYRIPSSDEINAIEYFFYDASECAIKDKQMTSGIAAQFRNEVARRVLLRTAATVFMSDEHEMIKMIRLNGYFCDDSTDGRVVTAIKLRIPRSEIIDHSPDFIDLKEDFRDRFMEERSTDLYIQEPYQLREMLSKPRIQSKSVNKPIQSRKKN